MSIWAIASWAAVAVAIAVSLFGMGYSAGRSHTISRKQLDRLCAEAVKIHRILERDELPEKEDLGSVAFHFELLGRMIGIRESICVLMGWDIAIEGDKEGRADELIIDWWKKHYPEEWDG